MGKCLILAPVSMNKNPIMVPMLLPYEYTVIKLIYPAVYLKLE